MKLFLIGILLTVTFFVTVSSFEKSRKATRLAEELKELCEAFYLRSKDGIPSVKSVLCDHFGDAYPSVPPREFLPSYFKDLEGAEKTITSLLELDTLEFDKRNDAVLRLREAADALFAETRSKNGKEAETSFFVYPGLCLIIILVLF